MAYFYYTIIKPVLSTYSDFGDKDILSYEIPLSIGPAILSIVGANMFPQMIRIKLQLNKEEDLNPSIRQEIDRFNHEAVVTLRAAFNWDFELAKIGPAGHFGFRSEGEKPNKGSFQIREEIPVSEEKFFKVRESLKKNWEVSSLYMESTSYSIPTNYRFLSLYRILEIIYKSPKNGKWDPAMDSFLGKFDGEFNQTFFEGVGNRKVKKHLETLRNRCTHGKYLYKNAVSLGITGIDIPEIIGVKKFFPFYQKVIKAAIKEKIPGLNLP